MNKTPLKWSHIIRPVSVENVGQMFEVVAITEGKPCPEFAAKLTSGVTVTPTECREESIGHFMTKGGAQRFLADHLVDRGV